MTLPAHCRALLLFLVTSFAVGVKGLHQGRLVAGSLQLMAIRASLVFGGFIFHQTAVIVINMMADVAFINLGEFIVIIMPKHGRRTPGIFKCIVGDKHEIILWERIDDHDQVKNWHR